MGKTKGKKENLKSRYKKSLIATAERAAKAGACDQEIAELLGCHLTTYYRWRNKYEDFDTAICDARLPSTAELDLQRLEQRKEDLENWLDEYFKNQGMVVEVCQTTKTGYKKIRKGGMPDLRLIDRVMGSAEKPEEFTLTISVATPEPELDIDSAFDDIEIGIDDDVL